MTARCSTVVVGGGISGLSVAWWLQREGIDTILLEKELQVGGTMRSVEQDGWLMEHGPNSALETTTLFSRIFDELGISHERVYANPSSKKRYILRGGQLHALPMSLGSFIGSPLWSPTAKLRLFKEPFVGRAGREESVTEFIERRLGKEFLDYGFDPFVAGIYAGDPGRLSIQAAFPDLYALEEKYGGLIRGLINGRKERSQREDKPKSPRRMFSFTKGMQAFPLAIARALGKSLKVGCSIKRIIRKNTDDVVPAFTIHYEQGGEAWLLEADSIVLSVPAYVASEIVRPFAGPLADRLDGIFYPPVGVVFFGFQQAQIKTSLDGFGFLVPGKEQRQILGTIWSSSLFPPRAPSGHVALTTFVGGSRQPEIMSYGDEQLIKAVANELRPILRIEGDPVFSRVTRWERAIPQYTLGYGRILGAVEHGERDFPGLFFCANYREGVSVGDCVKNGEKTARRVQEFLKLRIVENSRQMHQQSEA